jgi:hypothetical protein
MESNPRIVNALIGAMETNHGALKAHPSVNLRVKAIARHGAQSQGVLKNHNWNWEGYLGAIMLESYFAGGFLCPKLPTFEPKMVKKVHPGAKRSILRSGGSLDKRGSP